MRLPQVRCSCSELIVKSDGDRSKIRSKVLIVEDGKVYAICKGCNEAAEVPLQVDEEHVYQPIFVKKV